MTEKALSMLVHGYSKVGKSLLAASASKPLLYLDVEAAARFLPIASVSWDPVNPPPTLEELKDQQANVVVVAVDSWTTATLAADWLKYDNKHPFKGVAVDSVSELQMRNLIHIGGDAQMKTQDWGETLRNIGGFLRGLRDLTYSHRPLESLVVTAMSKLNQDTGILRPHLQGQMADTIPYLMDITGYLYVNTDGAGVETRYLLTRRRDNKEAGERVGGRIPPVLRLPTVSGETAQEVMEKNRTFEGILKKVFAAGAPKIAPPAKVEVPQQPSDSEGTTEAQTPEEAAAEKETA